MEIKHIVHPIDTQGHYSITDTGLVFRNWKKKGPKLCKQRIKDKGRSIPGGYSFVGISINGEAKEYRVHRLVALHFIDNPHNLPFVNHKDGNKNNNHKDNLEWTSDRENQEHALKELGHHTAGYKLKESDVPEIYRLLCIKRGQDGFLSVKKIGEQFGVSFGAIRNIHHARSYRHLITREMYIEMQNARPTQIFKEGQPPHGYQL